MLPKPAKYLWHSVICTSVQPRQKSWYSSAYSISIHRGCYMQLYPLVCTLVIQNIVTLVCVRVRVCKVYNCLVGHCNVYSVWWWWGDGGVWCMVCGVWWWWCVVYGSLVVNHCHRQEVTLSPPPPHELSPQSPINEEFYYSAMRIHSLSIHFSSLIWNSQSSIAVRFSQGMNWKRDWERFWLDYSGL